MKFKRFLSMLLALTMVLSYVPFGAFATETGDETPIVSEETPNETPSETPSETPEGEAEIALIADEPTVTTVANEAELAAALAVGGEIKIADGMMPINVTNVLTIAEGVSVVLDLNGRAVMINDKYLHNKGNLTIKNGTLMAGTFNDTTNGAALFNEGTLVVEANVSGVNAAIRTEAGKVTINSGNISATADNGMTAQVIRVKGGEVIINGGNFVGCNATNPGEGCSLINASAGSVTIYGGNFSGFAGQAMFPRKNVTVYGGTFAPHQTEGFSLAQLMERAGALATGYEISADGVVSKTPITGSITPAFTSSTGFWGEGGGNALESYVVTLYEGDKVIATATLNNIGGIINGNVYVTWNIPFAASNDEYWTVVWANGYPNADMAPTKVTLTLDGNVVAENNHKWNAPDDLGKIVAKASQDGVFVGYFASLADAVAAGNEVTITAAGSYAVPSGKDCTITGAVEGVAFEITGEPSLGGADITFNNVTFNYAADSFYKGLQYAGNMVYNNCTFNGQVFLYGESETFNNCTFNNTGDNYNVWTYGAKAVEFNGCTFNCDGKAVLVYNEGACATELEVVDTDFIASAPVNGDATGKGKAAIEIDTSLMPSGTVIDVDAATTATNFSTNTLSESSLWHDKKVDTTNENGGGTTSTVIVNDETVKYPVMNFMVGEAYYSTLETAAAAAAQSGEAIKLLVDITVAAGETVNLTGITLKGNGFKLTNNSEISFTDSTLEGVTIEGSGTTRFYNEINFYGENNILSAINGTPFHLIVNKGATLLITRFVLGYNRNITVYGEIEDAHNFDPAGKTPSLKFNSTSGVSVGGNGTGNLTVKDAYIELGNSSWKSAQGTYEWTFTNSYVSATSFTNTAAPGSDAAEWNVTFDDSVLAAKSYIKNGANTTYNFTNGSVATTGSMRIDGELNIDATSSVTVTAQMNNKHGAISEHEDINGTVNVAGTLSIGGNSYMEVLTGELNVNGGTVNITSAKPLHIAADGTVNVNSGTVNGNLDVTGKLNSQANINGTITAADSAKISISAGIYTMDVSKWCADGYSAIDNGDGTFKIKAEREAWILRNGMPKYYGSLAEAVADAQAGETIILAANIELSERINIDKDITIGDYGTLTVSIVGNGGINVIGDANVTLDSFGIDISRAAAKGDCIIGVGNYSNNGKLTLNNVNVTGSGYTSAYAVFYVYNNSELNINGGNITLSNDKASSGGFIKAHKGKNGIVNITDAVISLTDAKIGFLDGTVKLDGVELNIKGGANAINQSALTVIDSSITVDGADGRALTLSQGDVTVVNSTLNFSNCSEGEIRFKKGLTLSIDATSTIADCNVYADASAVDVANVNGEVINGIEKNMSAIEGGKVVNPTWVAKAGNAYYMTLEEAIAAGGEVTLLADVALNKTIKVKGTVVLNLNGKNIVGTDNATGSFALIEIQPAADLTINGEGKITLTAANDRDFNAYSSVISNQRGKLTVNGGVIEHLGGTDMAYGIDNLTNGKGTYAETIINGGTVKSTYRAIRQFLNGTEAQNILTVNGGTIEGTNKAIWTQDANTYANSGAITIGENATVNGTVYLTVSAGSPEWDLEVSIPATADVVTTNVPAGYELIVVDGSYTLKHGVAKIGNEYYATLKEALAAVQAGENTITLLAPIAEDVVIEQVEGVNITIVGNGNVYTGTMEIWGHARYDGAETLTIQNVKFETSEAKHDFITCNTTDPVKRYAHNVTVEGCYFTATGAAVNSAVGLRLRQCYNIEVENSTATGLHSLIQATGGTTMVIDTVTVDGCKNGIAAGTTDGVTVKNSTINVTGYGVRADGNAASDMTVSGSTITAAQPVVVRNTTAAYELSVSDNTLTSTTGKYQVVITKGDDGVDPVNPKVDFEIKGDISDLNVYPNSEYNFSIGQKGYLTMEDALAAVQNGDTIAVMAGAVGNEGKTEIEFTKDIEFTITGKAPEYALPIITFQNATVNIKDAEILIPELDARQNATINVIDSIVHDAGGNSIAKSYYNGAINISGNSVVYMMQVTTMGYITLSDTAVLNATWQINVYGNGMITVMDDATVNTGALHLTGKDYSGRDNTDADRVGKPATIIVDGATFNAGKVYSDNGADYSYNSGKGMNIGTVDGKSVVLDVKNGATVNFYLGDGETVNIGANGTVNVDGIVKVACRKDGGSAKLVNDGSIVVNTIESAVIANKCGNVTGADVADYKLGYVDGAYKLVPKEYVAQIGDLKFESLSEALAVVKTGDNTITLLDTVNEDVVIEQVEGVNITIVGNGNVYTGTMEIYGHARYDGAETLTIQNVKFETSEAKHDFITCNTTDPVKRYAHNVTVDGCSFTATGAAVDSAVGLRMRQCYNIVVKNSTATDLHSLLQATGGTNLEIDTVTVNGQKNGIAVGTTKGVTVKDSTINVGGYGVRADGNAASDMTVSGNTITAAQPVVVRRTTAAYDLNVTGNTLNAPEGAYQVVITEGEDDAAYVNPTGAFALASDVDTNKVYPAAAYAAQVGDYSYTSVEAALEAAENDDTVIILKELTVEKTIVVTKSVTIDLNGLTLTGKDVYPVIRVQNNAYVTIDNGVITNDDYVFVLGASDGSSYGYLTILGGNYHGETTVASVTKGELVVEGGYFSVKSYDGEGYQNFNYLLNCVDANYAYGDANIVVKGGSFENFNPADNAAEGLGTNFVDSLYEATTTNGVVWNVNAIAAGEIPENPIYVEWIWNDEMTEATATVSVPANATYYFAAYGMNGTVLTVNGEELEYVPGFMFFTPATFEITNGDAAEAIYELKISYPIGSQNNPAELVIGDNTAAIEAGNDQGYFFTYTAPADGVLTITMPEGGWTYVINNLTTYQYGDMQWSDSDPVVNPAIVEFAEGDELQIVVNNYDPANPWNTPAGELTINVADGYPAGHEQNPIDLTADLLYEDDFSATVTVPAGETYNFVAYKVGGMIMSINGGEGVACVTTGMWYPYAWTITNDGAEAAEYVITVSYPIGNMQNPAQLVIGDNTASIEADSQGYCYTWTAEEDGELFITMPEGDWTYVINNMTTYQYGDTQWSDSDPVVNPGVVSVNKGDEIQIMVNTYDPANPWGAPAGELTVTAEFVAAPGTKVNPIGLFNQQNTVTAEGTSYDDVTYYFGYFNNMLLTVEGEGDFAVIYNGESVAAVDGKVEMSVASASPRMPVNFAIDGNGDYAVNVSYPVGHMENAAQLVIGNNTASIEAGNSMGYFFSWTADKDGVLIITMPEGDWMYAINNLTAYQYGDTQWSDSDSVVNPAYVNVSAGDEIQIIVNSYDPANMWNNPAAEITFVADFMVPVAMNKTTGKIYGSVAEALATAKAGQTVVLTADASEDMIFVRSGITLDLNGYTLTASDVAVVNSAHIVDNSADNAGLLAVDSNNVMISRDNKQLPVRNGNGYIFVDVDVNSRAFVRSETVDGFIYMFQPVFEETARILLADGAADNELTIEVRVSWDTEETREYRNLVFNEAQIKAIIGAAPNGAFVLNFNGFKTVDAISGVTVETVINTVMGVSVVSNGHNVDFIP